MLVALLLPILFALETKDIQPACCLHFTDVAEQANVRGNFDLGQGCAFCDIDSDGFLDLFVGSRDADNILYHNNGDGTFTDITEKAGVGRSIGTPGFCFSDFDNDGDPELFLFYGFNVPDILLKNDDSGHFTDVTEITKVGNTGYGRGSQFLDVNQDGWLDLFIGNADCQRSSLYVNTVRGPFIDRADIAGVTNYRNVYGSAFGDYDNDGDLDFYVTNIGDANRLYRNDLNRKNYIKVKLVGTVSNRDAIGAKVKLYDGEHAGEQHYFRQYREINSNSGLYGKNAFECHFGVKPCCSYDIVVTFPSGLVEVVPDIRAPRTIIIHKSGKLTQSLSAATGMIPEKFVLDPNYPNLFQTCSRGRFALPYQCRVLIRIYDGSGRVVKELHNQELNAGWHEVAWDGTDSYGERLPNGIHFYRVDADDFSAVNKIVRLK